MRDGEHRVLPSAGSSVDSPDAGTMPRRPLSPAQQRVHKPDKSMAQKWPFRRCGSARSRRAHGAEGFFRNDDRVLRTRHWPVEMMKGAMKCSQFIGLAKHAPERFEKCVMAVTGPMARYSCARLELDEFFLQILNTCRLNSGSFGFGSRMKSGTSRTALISIESSGLL
jgi:hypothetical protein